MLPPSLYNCVFKSSPIGAYLLSPSPELTILDVNDSFLNRASLTRKGMIGKGLFEVFPASPNDPNDTGVEALRQSIADAIATGETQFMEAQRYPIPKTLPNGEVVFEERFWNATNTPIFADTGNLLCIHHTTIDVTKEVKAEAALQQSEKRLSLALKAAGTAVWDMDVTTGEIIPANDLVFTMLGYEPGDIRTSPEWISLIHEEDLPGVPELILDVIEGRRESYWRELRLRTKDGSWRWTLSQATAAERDTHGRAIRLVGTHTDFNERKLAEERLKETDRRKDEFLAMLAHELRNPLAPISSAAHLLQIANFDKGHIQRTSEVILRQVKHMTSLVDDLLDVSRVTRGLVELDNAALDLQQIVAEAVEQATPLIQTQHHRLVVHHAPDTAIVIGDKKRLVQVIVNLVNNSAKYTPSGGNIAVKTEVRDMRVILDVTDDGIGMEPKLVERVFDLFAQAEVTSDRSSGGLGLGLALVKSIVELHGGTVTCESAGIGRGSRFTICLPRAVESTQPVSAQQQLQSLPIVRKPLRLLIVDDNVDAATMLAILLEAAGHEVFVEHSPKHALERARIEMPDVCLLDIGLPTMDGYELAQRLRTQPETANSVLIAVTGYGQEHDRKHSLVAGFAHHFVKPVDTGQLMSILQEIMRVEH